MTQIVIDIGAVPNDGTGDPLRTAFNDVNLNFANVFAAGPVDSNIQIVNNRILTTNTNGNLVLAPNGIGVVQSNVSIVPNLANVRNLGSPALRWNTVYTQYIDYIQGNITTDNISITGTLTAPNIVVNNISSDDSTFVTIQDGLGVQGNIIGDGTLTISSIVTTEIRSDDSSFVTIQDGLNVVGGIETHGNITADAVSAISNITAGVIIITTPVPYANLIAVAGGRAFINNGNLMAAGNFGNQISGGGSNVIPVWSNGSNWYIG